MATPFRQSSPTLCIITRKELWQLPALAMPSTPKSLIGMPVLHSGRQKYTDSDLTRIEQSKRTKPCRRLSTC